MAREFLFSKKIAQRVSRSPSMNVLVAETAQTAIAQAFRIKDSVPSRVNPHGRDIHIVFTIKDAISKVTQEILCAKSFCAQTRKKHCLRSRA